MENPDPGPLWQGVGAGALSHPCELSLALQCDPVDAGEGGAAALPQPQAPEHREAAQVVPGMEGEGQVSPSWVSGEGSWRQGRQPAAFRNGKTRKMHTLANASSTEDAFRYQNYNFKWVFLILIFSCHMQFLLLFWH